MSTKILACIVLSLWTVSATAQAEVPKGEKSMPEALRGKVYPVEKKILEEVYEGCEAKFSNYAQQAECKQKVIKDEESKKVKAEADKSMQSK